MERNIGDQLNKAFEAYRQVSIEKDNAKKELQQMTEYYKRYTQKLQKQIEDQQQLISQLEAKLSATRPSGEMKCEPSCNHLLDEAAPYRMIQYPENMGTVAPNMPVNSSSVDYQDMLDAFEAIQGKFRQIQSLTRRQKDHLKRFHGGNDTANDQRFSMPIQCTDRTAEAETPFPSARSAVDIPILPTSLASRGASPEDRDLVDSLTKFNVKFPPPEDSEYDFLNSAPERHIGLPVKRPPGIGSSVPSTLPEEELVELPMPFVYPPSPSHATSSSSSSLSQEGVRGPQQPLWSPELCDSVDVEAELAAPQSSSGSGGSSPDKCAFCHAVVPQDRMNSHLYSHFSPKNEADD